MKGGGVWGDREGRKHIDLGEQNELSNGQPVLSMLEGVQQGKSVSGQKWVLAGRPDKPGKWIWELLCRLHSEPGGLNTLTESAQREEDASEP